MPGVRPQRWLVFALLAAILLGLAYLGLGLRSAYRMTHVARKRLTQFEKTRASQAFPTLRQVSFHGADALVLRGWYVAPQNGIVVVYVPGVGGNRTDLLSEAELLVRHGYGALLFDPRAHGESDGQIGTWGDRESEDTRRAVRLVRAFPEVKHVVLLGFSVGASTVVLAGADNPAVDAVIVCACWTSLQEEIQDKTRRRGALAAVFARWGFELWGTDVLDMRPVDRIARVSPRPLLLVAGSADTDTPLPVMKRMFEAAARPKELWIVPGVGHGGYFEADPKRYEEHVLGFLRRVFGV